MNREIKFRAKNEKGKWLFGDLLSGHRNMQNSHYYIREQEDFPEVKELITQVIPSTVSQFTGLFDKNGIEIYEGGILKFNNHAEFFEVKFERGAFCANGDYLVEIDNVEVIGNIHDNPQLLTEKTI